MVLLTWQNTGDQFNNKLDHKNEKGDLVAGKDKNEGNGGVGTAAPPKRRAAKKKAAAKTSAASKAAAKKTAGNGNSKDAATEPVKAPFVFTSAQIKTETIEVTIKGSSPLLMNPLTDATLEGLRTGVHPPVKKDGPASDVARTRVYRAQNFVPVKEGDLGPVVMPSVNFLACLVEAGRSVKNGKKQISTASTTTLYSFLEILEPEFPLTDLQEENTQDGEGWITDCRRGVLAQNNIAVCIVRPRFDIWSFRYTMTIDLGEIDEGKVAELITTAGKKVGLCDFRPAKRGHFGRFAITDWKKVNK
ncbi:MAG: hypothetical protein CMI53_00645 [Parcubacteria group bacterium]|nr:hypothetical protein [Parcubacteria group bacterium]|tara:strand:+ start:5348 stop:6256 length:909 start_codon:yes stop_codon:yes gene_type:complete